MSGKYDLLTSQSDRISGFDAIETPKRARTKWKSWKCPIIALVVILLGVVALTLVIVIAVEVVKHNHKSKGDVNPSNQCPADASPLRVPCMGISDSTEDPCSAASCCLYNDRCILKNYKATCTSDSHKMFSCLPEMDNWNNTFAKQECTRRGCCWNTLSNPIVKCFYPLEYGYVTNGNIQDTPTGKAASLTRRSPQPSMYSGDIEQLQVEVTYESKNMIHVKVWFQRSLFVFIYIVLLILIDL